MRSISSSNLRNSALKKSSQSISQLHRVYQKEGKSASTKCRVNPYKQKNQNTVSNSPDLSNAQNSKHQDANEYGGSKTVHHSTNNALNFSYFRSHYEQFSLEELQETLRRYKCELICEKEQHMKLKRKNLFLQVILLLILSQIQSYQSKARLLVVLWLYTHFSDSSQNIPLCLTKTWKYDQKYRQGEKAPNTLQSDNGEYEAIKARYIEITEEYDALVKEISDGKEKSLAANIHYLKESLEPLYQQLWTKKTRYEKLREITVKICSRTSEADCHQQENHQEEGMSRKTSTYTKDDYDYFSRLILTTIFKNKNNDPYKEQIRKNQHLVSIEKAISQLREQNREIMQRIYEQEEIQKRIQKSMNGSRTVHSKLFKVKKQILAPSHKSYYYNKKGLATSSNL